MVLKEGGSYYYWHKAWKWGQRASLVSLSGNMLKVRALNCGVSPQLRNYFTLFPAEMHAVMSDMFSGIGTFVTADILTCHSIMSDTAVNNQSMTSIHPDVLLNWVVTLVLCLLSRVMKRSLTLKWVSCILLYTQHTIFITQLWGIVLWSFFKFCAMFYCVKLWV